VAQELGEGVRLVDAVHAVERLAERLGAVLGALAALTTCEERLSEAAALRDGAVDESPFADADAVEAALLPPTERDHFARTIDRHRTQVTRVATLYAAEPATDDSAELWLRQVILEGGSKDGGWTAVEISSGT
jgi:hypothetical protein